MSEYTVIKDGVPMLVINGHCAARVVYTGKESCVPFTKTHVISDEILDKLRNQTLILNGDKAKNQWSMIDQVFIEESDLSLVTKTEVPALFAEKEESYEVWGTPVTFCHTISGWKFYGEFVPLIPNRIVEEKTTGDKVTALLPTYIHNVFTPEGEEYYGDLVVRISMEITILSI